MHIWVDADACPKVIKEILYRAVKRLQIPMTMVANKALYIPKSPLIQMLTVATGADVAHGEIVARVEAGDLVNVELPPDIDIALRVTNMVYVQNGEETTHVVTLIREPFQEKC